MGITKKISYQNVDNSLNLSLTFIIIQLSPTSGLKNNNNNKTAAAAALQCPFRKLAYLQNKGVCLYSFSQIMCVSPHILPRNNWDSQKND